MWTGTLTMTTCPFCQITHVPNTVFCTECGYYLLGHSESATDPLDMAEIGWLGEPKGKPSASKSSPHKQTPLTLRLRIEVFNQEFEVLLKRPVEIGRSDPRSAIRPDIDLASTPISNITISRRHARIAPEKDYVVIEDLGSVNGTYLNGQRLAPFLPELLVAGDTLQLGKLLIRVEF